MQGLAALLIVFACIAISFALIAVVASKAKAKGRSPWKWGGGAALMLGLAVLSPNEAERLDAEARRLCAIDGGLEVYETVALPAEEFNSRGNVNIRGDKVLVGSSYTLKFHQRYYKGDAEHRGSGSVLLQFRIELIRNSDGKVLGESRIYERGGGGFLDWLADAPSHFECPAILEANEDALARLVFIPSRELGKPVRASP